MKMEPLWMSRCMIKAPKIIVIDTIPLLLFLIGTYDTNLISKFKRLKTYNYSVKNFTILKQFLAHAQIIIVTPGVLCEVSNFAANLKVNRFSEFLKENSENFKNMEESYIPKKIILESEEVFQFGFTDTSLIIAAKNNGGEILTGDFPLSRYCQNLGVGAQYLNDIFWEIDDIFK